MFYPFYLNNKTGKQLKKKRLVIIICDYIPPSHVDYHVNVVYSNVGSFLHPRCVLRDLPPDEYYTMDWELLLIIINALPIYFIYLHKFAKGVLYISFAIHV